MLAISFDQFRSIFASLVLMAMSLMAMSSWAEAQGICVSCTEPAVSYQCSVQHVDKVNKYMRGEKAVQLMRLACIKDIARLYGHASCQVGGETATTCVGKTHMVSFQSLIAMATAGRAKQSTPPETGPVTAEQKPQLPGAPKPNGDQKRPPRTVAELIKNSTKGSEKQLKKARDALSSTGKAVGGSLNKTWRCLRSLFKDC